MPLYPYRCKKCGYRFEKIQSFQSEPETECPQCGGALERPLTAPGLQFKGTGWYVSDYAAKSAPAGELSSAESKTPGAEKAPGAEKSSAAGTSDAPRPAPPASAGKPDASKG